MDNNVRVILEGLNEQQRAGVECTEGPVLIVAGAGSGKTRVLTGRVAYLIARGTAPSGILALTFTKKAAGEMKERIGLMTGPAAARKVVMGTFHSVFVRFLRQYAASIGYPEQFTIYDTSDSLSAMKSCIKELALDDKEYKPKEILSHISKAKNNLITVKGYKDNAELMAADMQARKPRRYDLYALYQQKLKAAGVMDFDDILVNMNILLKDDPAACAEIASRFTHILVDEYQDTNYAQYLILKRLAAPHRNICVVGDDSQSIYAFRGAKIENIFNFKKDYPDCRMFRLERNYRSTRTIVDAANTLIAHNSGRIPKTCFSEAEQGEKIRILKTYGEMEEAVKIVSEIIDRMRSDGATYRDFALLYRTNSQSRSLEEQLRRRNIPYMIYSGNSFFERAEVKDMMAWFKLVVNPHDDESFKRAVGKPSRGIGDVTLAAVADKAREQGCSLFKAGLQHPKTAAFCTLVDGLAASVPVTDAHEMALRIADKSGLYAFYKADTSIEGLARTANVEELLNSVKAFVEERTEDILQDSPDAEFTVTLPDFLEEISLLSAVDTSSEEDDSNRVALMTVHAAKGLEFPYVFVAGLEENLFPSGSLSPVPGDIEEERRLFYVAMTRAEKALALSFAMTRMRNGKHESNPPSRFIREIDRKYFENPLPDGEFSASDLESYDDVKPRFGGGYGPRFGSGQRYGASSTVSYQKRSPQPAPVQKPMPHAVPAQIDPDFKAVPMTELRQGERVEHNRFGAGVILELMGNAPEMKARINFDEYGEKLLLLKYAKLRHL